MIGKKRLRRRKVENSAGVGGNRKKKDARSGESSEAVVEKSSPESLRGEEKDFERKILIWTSERGQLTETVQTRSKNLWEM